MLTMFTVPKPFNGHIGLIQTNAIQSWLLIHPELEVLLLGNEEGTAEAASRFGIRQIPDIECNEYGTPLVSSAFSVAQQAAKYQIMCYVNADIILTSDFIPAIQRVNLESFMVLGQRLDLELKETIDFNDAYWESWLRNRLAESGKLHPATGIDYFIFLRGLYTDIPPFAIGRTSWDNWLVYRARSLKIPVIDATKAITAIHQNHDYSHHPEEKAGVWAGAEAQRNRKLAGGYNHVFNIRDATIVLTAEGIKKISTARIIERHCKRLARAFFSSTLAALRRLG
jgi:hypothetical protein